MSEEALLWAIKGGLPSSTRVRVEGQEVWIGLDDHEPFAQAIIERDAERQRRRPKKWRGYTRGELARFVVVFVGVLLLVGAYETYGSYGDGVFRGLLAKVRGRDADGELSDRKALSNEPDPGAVRQAETAASVASKSPAERAKMATEALMDGADPRAAVCRARALLDTLPEADKKKADVSRAMNLLSSKELPLLRLDQVEFEKTRGVICGDGTKPKDCACRGAHESCCALHKGVARCEPLPTRVKCL